MRASVVLALAVLALSACSVIRQVDSIAVPTSEPGPLVGQGCPAALLQGRLARDDRWGVAIVDEFGPQPVRWPNGYGAELSPGLVLRDGKGNAVAAEGDTVYVGGGMDPANELFVACGYVSRDPP
jgi:hypothetical protein